VNSHLKICPPHYCAIDYYCLLFLWIGCSCCCPSNLKHSIKLNCSWEPAPLNSCCCMDEPICFLRRGTRCLGSVKNFQSPIAPGLGNECEASWYWFSFSYCPRRSTLIYYLGSPVLLELLIVFWNSCQAVSFYQQYSRIRASLAPPRNLDLGSALAKKFYCAAPCTLRPRILLLCLNSRGGRHAQSKTKDRIRFNCPPIHFS